MITSMRKLWIGTIIASLIFSTSAGYSNEVNSPLFSQRILPFIEKTANSTYAIRITEEEMHKAYDFAGLTGLLQQTGRRASRVRGEQFSSTEYELQYREFEAELQKEAFAIAEDMYNSYSVEDLNLKFLVLSKHYLFNPSARGGIREIAMAFEGLIGENYFRELEKKQQTSDRYLKGTLWTGLGLALLSLRRPTRGGKTYLNSTRESSEAYLKNLRLRVNIAKSKTTNNVDTVTGIVATAPTQQVSQADTIARLRQLGAYIPSAQVDSATSVKPKNVKFYSPQMFKYQSRSFMSGLSQVFTRDYILRWMKAKTASDNFKNFIFLTGVSVAGGGAYATARNTMDAFRSIDLNDQYLDLREVLHHDYTALSTLMLQCQIKALSEDIAMTAPEEVVWNEDRLQFLLSWLADYELLRRFSMDAGTTQKHITTVSANYDRSREAYVAQVSYLNHTIEELIPCAAPTQQNTGNVEISLEEALLDLNLLIQASGD